jgi:RND family efflux transporter MFP subunit
MNPCVGVRKRGSEASMLASPGRSDAALAILFALTACGTTELAAPPPPQVVVAPVVQRDVPITSEWVGTIDGYNNAQIRAKVEGYLESRDYEEGRLVKAGQMLFTIDPREFRAALQDARGQLGRAEALLGKTRQDVARYGPLSEEGAVSRKEYDDAVQAARAGAAAVESGRAAVEKAQLDLDWSEVRSPIDGIAGLALAQIGDLVSPSTLLTTVSQLDPVKVTFPVSEREYLRYADVLSARLNGAPPADGGPQAELILADASVYPERGRLIAANREVDPQTGSILLQAAFPNPRMLLRPGQFARVRAVTETRRNALLVPQRAIQELQGNYRVAVLGDDDTVSVRTVKVGPRVGSEWIVEEGVAPGARVVVEGLQRVRDGVKVTVSAAGPEGAAPTKG